MTTSTDLVQIAIVPETVYAVTPTAPAFQIVRYTGEGIAFAPTTTQSNEMNARRQLPDNILTGGATAGNLNFELAKEVWFETLLSGAMCYTWASDTLLIGEVFKSFTIEKKIPITGGGFEYHRFPGCLVDNFSLDVKPNAVITGSFQIQGKTPTHATTALTGATYADPAYNPVFRAPRVVDIDIGGVAAISRCFDSFQITLNNNNRAVECIGTLGTKEVVLGQVSVTSTFSVLFNSSDLLDILLTQVATSLGITMEDDQGTPASYAFLLEKVKFTANQVVAGGSKQNLVNAVTAQAIMNPDDFNTMTITRV